MTDLRFIGHACVELTDGSSTVLLDPFLAPNNPIATITGDQVDPTTILTSMLPVDSGPADAYWTAANLDLGFF